MKKFELIEMLKDMADDEELEFIVMDEDRDGWPEERHVDVYKVKSAKECHKEFIAKQRAIYLEQIEWREKELAKCKDAIKADEGKESKAAKNRIAKNLERIEWCEESIKNYSEWIANLDKEED